MKFSAHGIVLPLVVIIGLTSTTTLSADRDDLRDLRYTLTELARLPGGDSSSAAAINDRRQIAGWSQTASGDIHAVLWDRGGRVTDLGTLPDGNFSLATDINNRGHVVGIGNTASDLQAVLWADGRVVSLGHLGSFPQGNITTANAINDHGRIVGSSTTTSGEQHAFLWQDGRMIDLGTLPGGDASIAWAINDRDQVVGVSTTFGEQHAFVWEKGKMTDLGKLPGGSFSSALDINNHREIAGTGDVAGNSEPRAFFKPRREDMRLLAGPTGGDSGFARALNEDGRVVGEGRIANGEIHALVWQGALAHDLGTLTGDLSSRAWDINQRDTIVGDSVTPDFRSRAVVWTVARED
jgi:probable HAF family extracellular repeat protein